MGNVAELAEKMDFLASDPVLRKGMGKEARRKLEEQYSLAQHNERLLEIYSALLEKRI